MKSPKMMQSPKMMKSPKMMQPPKLYGNAGVKLYELTIIDYLEYYL